MAKLGPAPLYGEIANRTGAIGFSWSRWFNSLYNTIGGSSGGAGALYIDTDISDIHTAQTKYIAIPRNGIVTAVIVTIQGTIVGSTETLNVRNASGNSMGTVSITLGGTAGTVFTLYPTSNNIFNRATPLSLTTGGLSSTVVSAHITLVFEYNAA